jgi:hypothetical protein
MPSAVCILINVGLFAAKTWQVNNKIKEIVCFFILFSSVHPNLPIIPQTKNPTNVGLECLRIEKLV